MRRSFWETMDREGRFGEVITTFHLLGLALMLAYPGDTLRFSEWWGLRSIGVSEPLLVLCFGLLGMFRAIVLWINGHHHRTPALRGVGAVISACLFAYLAILAVAPFVAGRVSALDGNVVYYLGCALADVRGVIRAGADHEPAKLAV